MRQLTPSLITAQQQTNRTPCVKVQVVNKSGGIIRQDWARYYSGMEDDSLHGAACPGDGSLIRIRITPLSDSRKLYRQRVAGPGQGSDFSQWVYTAQYDVAAAAVACIGAEVSIVWIKTNREIRRIKSVDYGVTWGSPELLDYSPTTSVYGITAAYKPGGNLAVFFADLSTLYVKKCISGQWQTKTAWDKTTGNLSGVACVHSNDWNLLITGQDTAGNYKLWSFVYGDGGDVIAGTWSALKEIATAPSGGDFSYKQPFMDKTDTYRCFFIEKFAGSEACSRPFSSCIVPGTHFNEGLWCEPASFNYSSEFGLSMAHCGDNSWLSCPGGVWHASCIVQTLNLSADIKKVRQELGTSMGLLTVELLNDDARYAFPGQGNLGVLKTGNRIEFSPGYITPQGEEYSDGQHYTIESLEHINAGGNSGLTIRAHDGWGVLAGWRARQQFRWNKSSNDFSVKDILNVILARAGIKLTVISQSSAVTGFYPDFTVNPGNCGKDIVQKLLSFVPDKIFLEGDAAYLVNPQPADTTVYGYGAAPTGASHAIVESKHRSGRMDVNRVQAEGWDTAAGKIIIADGFNWDAMDGAFERLKHVTDRNLNSVSEAGQRASAVLRQAEIEADDSVIVVPVNCGQQMFDVVSITDIPAGLSSFAKRVMGMTLINNPERAEYYHRLHLGRV